VLSLVGLKRLICIILGLIRPNVLIVAYVVSYVKGSLKMLECLVDKFDKFI